MKHLWNMTETYCDDNGYIVDIVSINMGTEYEAWIYHKDYGVKSFMYGMMSTDITKAEFTEMALAQYVDYVYEYNNQYMD